MILVYSAKEKNLTPTEFVQVYNIIIKAYADTESEMWGKNYVRVSRFDFQNLIVEDKVLVAFLNGEIVGGIRYYALDDTTWSFGLFGADFSKSRMGIGRALIAETERLAILNGAKKIKIEILRPTLFELPFKKKLAEWYIKLGYLYFESIDFSILKPVESKGLVCPSSFDYYVKDLLL